VTVTTSEERVGPAEEVLKASGAEDIKRGWERD